MRWLMPAVVLLAASAAFGQTQQSATPVAPNDIKWEDFAAMPKGAQIAVLHGDPSKEGPFTVRLKFPNNYIIPPHTHSDTEVVTVVSGSLKVALGEKVDEAALKGYQEGSFMVLPGGVPHYAQAAEANTVIQVNAQGPFDLKYVNPADDPRNK